MVPLAEINALLRHLDYTEPAFWDFSDYQSDSVLGSPLALDSSPKWQESSTIQRLNFVRHASVR